MKVVVLGAQAFYGRIDEPTVFLRATNWDDWHYKTEFDVMFRDVNGPEMELGRVKILARDYGPEPKDQVGPRYYLTRELLPPVSQGLESRNFCSLGQDGWYYRNLSRLPAKLQQAILGALCDVTLEPTLPNPWWRHAEGFKDSLLRLRSAQIARARARALLRGEDDEDERVTQIRYNRSDGYVSGGPDTFEVDFDGTLQVPGRLNVLVGKNGVGKSTLLAGLAGWFDRDIPQGKWEAYRPTFSRVLILSLNPFDCMIKLSNPDDGNVRFLGRTSQPATPALKEVIKKLEALKTPEPTDWASQLSAAFPTRESFLTAVNPKNPWAVGQERLPLLARDPAWPAFLKEALDSPELTPLLEEAPDEAYEAMSAGQRALVAIWAGLFEHLAPQSLLLIDEPENFLHPSLIARFARSLNDLLGLRKSFAIAATHSPILVQETPARFVSILERVGNTTTQRKPPSETFGESTDNLTEYLFGTDFRSSHWKRVLREFAKREWTLEQVQEKVSGLPLPLTAQTYYLYNRRLGGGK